MKKRIILFFILIELLIVFLCYKSFNHKNVLYEKINESKNEMFAIYLQQTNGSYAKSSAEKWPVDDYKYNSYRSGCIDTQGNELKDVLFFDNNTNKALLATNKQAYCFLYFDLSRALYTVTKNNSKLGDNYTIYNGSHNDSPTGNGEKNIYYFKTESKDNESQGLDLRNKWNVVFAGFCWQMFRTTDTGGVKMVYNGRAESTTNSNGEAVYSCGDNREWIWGSETHDLNMLSNAWYGTSYVYENGMYKLSGEKVQKRFKGSGTTLHGMYTCNLNSENGTCKPLYKVVSGGSTNTASVNTTIPFSTIGNSIYNEANSFTSLGYMYGDVYSIRGEAVSKSQSFSGRDNMITATSRISVNIWFADDVRYIASEGKYELINPYQYSSTDDLVNAENKYTFLSNSNTAKKSYVYYITNVYGENNGTVGIIQYQNNNKYKKIYYSNSVIDHNDGTYSLDHPEEFQISRWKDHRSDYYGKYFCFGGNANCDHPVYIFNDGNTNYTYYSYINIDKITLSKSRNDLFLKDASTVRTDVLYQNLSDYEDYKYTCGNTDTTCSSSNLKYITSFNNNGSFSFTYYPNRYFGASVTYDGSMFNLNDTIELEQSLDFNKLKGHHYYCSEFGSKRCSEVRFIYYYNNSFGYEYLTLSNGEKGINDVLYNMFKKNTTDSVVKTVIDKWYEDNLSSYSRYLDNVTFCNNRSFYNAGGLGENNSIQSKPIFGDFNGQTAYNDTTNMTLECPNEEDRFNTTNNKAKLKYPIGLLTAPEVRLINNKYTVSINYDYWLMSPGGRMNNSSARKVSGSYVYRWGQINEIYYTTSDESAPYYSHGVRPVIALKSGIEYSKGHGTTTSPFVVE